MIGKLHAGFHEQGGASNPVYTDNRLDNDEWFHVTFIKDKFSNTIYLYIDGELIETNSFSDGINHKSGQGLWIGNHLERLFKFSIDDVRIYNRALNEAEIQDLYKLTETQVERKTINGTVSSDDGKVISGINVKFEYLVEGEERSTTAVSDVNGNYEIKVDKSNFKDSSDVTYLMYAYKEGYHPSTQTLKIGLADSYNVDFVINPIKANEVVLEIEPKVHHLGDDSYSGSANSQFQKKTEGTSFSKSFDISSAQYNNYGKATLKFEAKGIQSGGQLRVNSEHYNLSSSPSDGSYTTYTIELEKIDYKQGNNSLQIISKSSGSDYDDFEFSNIVLEFESLLDSDSDGIPDERETELGLNPYSNDSDGDGILDLVEVGDINNPTDTDGDVTIDALDLDSDGDGYSDSQEIIAGTSPINKNDYPDNTIDKSNITGEWKGTYTCRQGLTGLTLTVSESTEDEVKAIFSFYPIDSNPNIPSGSFNMKSEYTENSTLNLKEVSWINKPSGYVMVGLNGSFNSSFNTYSGSVESTTANCTTFSLTKVSASTANSSSITGKVQDAVNSNPIANANIKLYQNGTYLSQVETDSSGIYTIPNLAGESGYSIEISKENYLTVNYHNIELEANAVKHLETVMNIEQSYAGEGDASGQITNSVDGKGVSGLLINFRKGINVHSGSIVRSETTGSNGIYNVSSLEAGSYTAELTGSGYQTSYITVVVLGGKSNDNQNGTINPILEEGEIRIVLTWGENPSDLDSHLTGPLEGSNNRFHVYWSEKGHINDSPYSNLDVDDIDSYGPETVTIRTQQSGVYRYSIHDYSNQISTSSSALANSGANVKVYKGSGLVAEYFVPNEAGTLWRVFEIDGGNIKPINSMSYHENEDTIE